jgi:S1-C subfamily serine protease
VILLLNEFQILNGGLFISAFDPESLMLQQGVCIGDILLSMQGQSMYGMDDYLSILMKIPPNTPINVSLIRWQSSTSHFQNLSITIPRKPLGVHFLPI